MPPVRKRRANKPGLETNTPPNVPARDLPAGVKRSDQPETPPDLLPPRDEDKRDMSAVGGGFTPKEDGGVEQHPIHDDDQEDLSPSDYERELDRLDAAARNKDS
jgi:hypothetical protein